MFHCGENGHFAKECPFEKKGESARNKTAKPGINKTDKGYVSDEQSLSNSGLRREHLGETPTTQMRGHCDA